MLVRPLYESLPPLCLLGGSAALALGDQPLLWLAGILLLGSGTLIWVMRSNYRRTDLVIYPARRWLKPEWLYELQPFLLLLLALLLSHWPLYGPWLALLPGGWALRCLLLRQRRRHHATGLTRQLRRHRGLTARRSLLRR
ncbi:hypothetical protein [Aeromonas simiae]|uniref:hypothetical protein n=1 Tax=Aeromonas simiae TaxID=218936 RepID=UPI0005A8F23D|nr:hypothetical protein [Aeromonas simiae]